MVSFVNSIVFEYRACQSSLYSKKEPDRITNLAKRSMPSEQTASLKRKALTFDMKPCGLDLIRSRFSVFPEEESDLVVCVKRERLATVPPSKDLCGVYNLNLPLYLHDSVEKLLRIKDGNIPAVISSSHDGEKIALLGEMLLHSFVNDPPGIHLVIASQLVIRELANLLLGDVFNEGLFFSWFLLEETSEQREAIRASYLESLSRFFTNYTASDAGHLVSIIRPLSCFDTEKLFPLLAKMKIPRLLLDLLRDRVLQHLLFIDERAETEGDVGLVCEDIATAADRVSDIFEESNFTQKLEALANLAEKLRSPKKLLLALKECYKAVSTAKEVVGALLFSANMLVIDPRRWDLKIETYPTEGNYECLARFSPAQILQHAEKQSIAKRLYTLPKTESVVVLATPSSLMDLDLAKLSLPIRSLHHYGYEKMLSMEWRDITDASLFLKDQTHAFDIPIFFYTETTDSRAHHCDLDPV